MHDDIDDTQAWNNSLATELPGQRVVIGLDYFEADGEQPYDQKQLFGRILSADPNAGITVTLEGQQAGEEFVLPPHTGVFHRAAPGEYRLRSTGEVVLNPDFTVTYSIYDPADRENRD